MRKIWVEEMAAVSERQVAPQSHSSSSKHREGPLPFPWPVPSPATAQTCLGTLCLLSHFPDGLDFFLPQTFHPYCQLGFLVLKPLPLSLCRGPRNIFERFHWLNMITTISRGGATRNSKRCATCGLSGPLTWPCVVALKLKQFLELILWRRAMFSEA